METENVPDRSNNISVNNISVSIGLQNVIDRYGTDQNAIRYNGNIVIFSTHVAPMFAFISMLSILFLKIIEINGKIAKKCVKMLFF